jgi:pyruvate/2-oxoglutarate dehydrogenase complex dihydrolipoamide acyltransferase (E2) component
MMTVCWTYDERIEDGLYSFGYTNGVQQRLEQPDLLLAAPAELS